MLRASATALLFASLLIAPVWSPAAAEGFLDLRLGAAFPQDDTVRLQASGGGFVLPPSSRPVEFDSSLAAGLRGGYWFEGDARWVGIGMDLSYFSAHQSNNEKALDIYVLPVSPLLMLRVPIAFDDDDFPGGRVQPYAAIGPAFTSTIARVDVNKVANEFGLGALVEDDTDFYDFDFDVGLDVRGGIAVPIAPWIALFTEYRYTNVDLQYEDSVDVTIGGVDADVDLDVDLDTHHWTFGVSFRF